MQPYTKKLFLLALILNSITFLFYRKDKSLREDVEEEQYFKEIGEGTTLFECMCLTINREANFAKMAWYQSVALSSILSKFESLLEHKSPILGDEIWNHVFKSFSKRGIAGIWRIIKIRYLLSQLRALS